MGEGGMGGGGVEVVGGGIGIKMVDRRVGY